MQIEKAIEHLKDRSKNALVATAIDVRVVKLAIEVLDESKWIPISKGKPVATQRVLVTLKNECVCEVFYINKKFKFHEALKGGGLKEVSADNPVIAWKPLPEPYQVD